MPKKLFEKGNPGKPVGAKNKTTQLMKEIWAEAFYSLQKDPEVNLITWAKKNPEEFYKLGIRLIPTQMSITADVKLEDAVISFK